MSSGILTLGLGSWGSVGELLTLGFESAEPPDDILGPCIHAAMVYLPGAKAGTNYLSGARVGDVYLPGAKAGEKCC